MIKHQLLDDDSIIVTTLSGNVSFSDCEDCFNIVDDFLVKNEFAMVYWVVDAKDSFMTYGNFIKFIEATNNGLLAMADARITPLFVTTDESHDYLLAEFKNRYNWTKFPKFDTVDDAVSFAQYISLLQLV